MVKYEGSVDMGNRHNEFSEEDKKRIFERANGHCQLKKCQKRLGLHLHFKKDAIPGWSAWQAHHLKSVEDKGSGNIKNGIALCIDCHEKVTTGEIVLKPGMLVYPNPTPRKR